MWLVVEEFVRKWILPVLVFSITLPLWVFLVAGIWLYFDRGSAIRTAVNKAVTELVAGAELDALNATLVEERRLRVWSDGKAEEQRKIADEERSARIELETQLTLTDAEKKEMADELAKIESSPPPADCRVDQQFLDGLRNK
ncbi:MULTISPECIES: hypothetical protein [Mesorhizobium]|uniref:hypothetical protein n=3 Tax=Phyllobacteriaceae TaxID=69277 RepID=UPI0007A943B6|nr:MULTISPECIES: hypothetical protein [Mesorhizobium]AMX93605.1 hypothetical protein A4R28_11110 [Mesorhizobium ciceri]MDF3208297.1 hypothetical protein [Mesorhizobium sp. LMG15046]MDF3229131.1 hypothetical protein [Mesorhizobium sp. DSM 30133]RUU22238.1 hypothetical protein EOC84_03770 [Mesorhizobium sp. Primo-B]RUU37853.1 hypothetical protein EOC83_16445 [Mesorhizobium sp. Primo-A]